VVSDHGGTIGVTSTVGRDRIPIEFPCPNSFYEQAASGDDDANTLASAVPRFRLAATML